MDETPFFLSGWMRLPHDDAVADWAARARPVAEKCFANPELRARWLRCGGTWFVGVNVLPNDTAGAVEAAGVPPLSGPPVRFIEDVLKLPFELDRAQISVCLPGYPRPSPNESEAAFRFRRDRDAAHVDGVRRVDFDGASRVAVEGVTGYEGRRRRLGEPHGFILGLPLTEAPPNAAPPVVWEGSHEVIRRALRARLSEVPPERWVDEDVTDAYVAARRECFETCRRVPVHAWPGEAYVIHRLALHGVAPWAAGTADAADRRAIAYFRPNPFPCAAPDWWLERP